MVWRPSRSSDDGRERRAEWRRPVAAAIDLALALALAAVLSPLSGVFFAERAVPTLHIGSPDTLWQGPLPMVLGIFGELVYGYPFALLLVLGREAFGGASPGKRLLRLRIEPMAGTAESWRMRRFALKTSGLWLALGALLAGDWHLAALSALLITLVALTTLAALLTSTDPLYDRLAHATVRRIRSPESASGPSAGARVPEASGNGETEHP